MLRRLFAFTLALFVVAALPANARRHETPSPSPSPSATPVPTPTPLNETARMERLRRDIVAISAHAPGRLGIAVVDVKQFTRFTARGDEAFPLASVVKLPIALLAFRHVDQHTFDLEKRVPVTPAGLRQGASPIRDAHPHGGVTYTNVELLRAMLLDSDNTASDLVLGELGGPNAVNSFLTNVHLRGFDIRKSEADLHADYVANRTFAKGGDNGGSPNAVADLLLGLSAQEYTHLDSTNELIYLLSKVDTGDRRLRAGFPGDADFAHKTGTSGIFDGLADATNDAGILTLPDGRRVIVVAFLAESRAPLAVREATLESVATAVYRAYVP